MGAVYATKVMIVQLVMSMSAAADVLATAQIEVDLKNIPEGTNFTVKWRGRPIFIRHR